MAPHSSTLAWKIPWTEEPGRLQSWGREESDTTEQLPFHFSLSCIGEGNGSPLQCSCLENPRDGRAWWAAVYGVAQSRTRLKRLSSSSSSIDKRRYLRLALSSVLVVVGVLVESVSVIINLKQLQELVLSPLHKPIPLCIKLHLKSLQAASSYLHHTLKEFNKS